MLIKRLLIIGILVIGLMSYVNYHKENNKAFKVFGSYISVVVSGSMEPEIMTDDFIVYRKATEYKLDDIIVFNVNGQLIVHRIIEVRNNGFITKGDNNHSDDFNSFGVIKTSQILGKVTNNFHLLGIGRLLT